MILQCLPYWHVWQSWLSGIGISSTGWDREAAAAAVQAAGRMQATAGNNKKSAEENNSGVSMNNGTGRKIRLAFLPVFIVKFLLLQ